MENNRTEGDLEKLKEQEQATQQKAPGSLKGHMSSKQGSIGKTTGTRPSHSTENQWESKGPSKMNGNPIKHISKPMGVLSKSFRKQLGIQPNPFKTNGESYQKISKSIGNP